MKNINVLFIGCTSDHGGAPKSMLQMIKYLFKFNNVNPIVITPLHDGIINNFCSENNIKCYEVDYLECGFCKGKNFIKTFVKKTILYKVIYNKKHQSELEIISKIVENEKIDVIHTNVNRFTLGCDLGRKYNIPNIIHLREFADKDYNVIYYDKKIYNYFNDNCDKFIAISDVVKRHWVNKGIDDNKISIIYNGFEVPEVEKLKNINYDNGIRAIFVGNVMPTKGQLQVLKSINKLPKEVKEKFHVDFYGLYGRKAKMYLQPYIILHRLNKYVTFKGYVNNVEKVISNYNLGFMCSRSEAFGRVTIDYMLNGIPVIASNTGANPEIIKDKKNGFLYKYNDINDLSKKIIEVYNCKNIDNVVQYAYDNAVRKYDTIKSADKIYKVYEELLKDVKK